MWCDVHYLPELGLNVNEEWYTTLTKNRIGRLVEYSLILFRKSLKLTHLSGLSVKWNFEISSARFLWWMRIVHSSVDSKLTDELEVGIELVGHSETVFYKFHESLRCLWAALPGKWVRMVYTFLRLKLTIPSLNWGRPLAGWPKTDWSARDLPPLLWSMDTDVAADDGMFQACWITHVATCNGKNSLLEEIISRS